MKGAHLGGAVGSQKLGGAQATLGRLGRLLEANIGEEHVFKDMYCLGLLVPGCLLVSHLGKFNNNNNNNNHHYN